MCAYLILRDKVIKPLLAGVVRPFGRPPKNQTPVDQHYVRLREELNRTFETIGLAPALRTQHSDNMLTFVARLAPNGMSIHYSKRSYFTGNRSASEVRNCQSAVPVGCAAL
jgi:hypothetical protein